ncbi:MAG: O-antigen ligase family protein [Anaerolineales bacterium]|nr:O-antigen ligase family protein [Anaerolineales bacterium]
MLEQIRLKVRENQQQFIFAVLAVLTGAAIGLAVGQFESMLLLALPVGLVFAALTFLNPELGILLFVFITYIRFSDVLVHSFGVPSIAKGMVGLLVLAILARWAVLKRFPEGWLRVSVLIAAYGFVVFGSILHGRDYARALAAVSDYWKDGLIAILMVLLIQKRETFRGVIWMMIFAGIFMGSISMHQYLTGNFSSDYFGFATASYLNISEGVEGNRISGPLGDPNYYAQILVFLFPLAVDRFFREPNRYLKITAGYAAFVIGMTIVFTFSRGGAVAAVLAMMVLVIYHPPKLKNSILILGVIWIGFLLLPSTYTDRLSTLTDLAQSNKQSTAEVSFRGRISEVLSAWYMFRDYPILGVGVQNYPVYYQEYSRSIGLDPRAEAREPHNLYLEVAAETGVLGLMIFGTILVSVFQAVRRVHTRLREWGEEDMKNMVEAFSSGLVGYLGAAMFIHGAYPRYLWLLVGIALSLTQVFSTELSTKGAH